MIPRPVFIWMVLFLMLISCPRLRSQIISPVFTSNEPFKITLVTGLKTLIDDVDEEQNYHDALISYTDEDGEPVSIPVEVRSRGHFRKDPGNCDFPPIKVRFPEELTGNTVFSGVDELKMVTHCRTRRSVYENYLLKEYMAYRLYNLFTKESYRVRLLDITFIDRQGRMDPIEKYAFFIEGSGEMARRNGAETIKIMNVQQEDVHPQKMTTLSVFQFMIGNTDWSVPGLHNIKLIRDSPGNPPVAVPFDFDWTGIVDAHYATPNPKLPLESVRDRLYRGLCRAEGEFLMEFVRFREKKEEIHALIRDFTPLEEKEREKIPEYIDGFYNILDNPRAVRTYFYKSCRGKD